MKIKKIAAATLASAMALSALAACGSSDDKPAADESKTVTLWLAGAEDTPKPLEAWLVKEYAKRHAGKTLKVEHIEWGELMPRLNTSLQSKDTPDVVEVGNTQSPTFTSVGAFTDLTDRLDELGDNIGPKGFVEAGTFDGKVSAVPYYWGSRYIFYSKKAFADAGIDVPSNLDDFQKAATQLKTDKTSGLWLPGQDWRNGISWIFANGGDIAVKDGDKWVGKLSAPEAQAGLKQIQELYKGATLAPKDGLDAEPWVPFNNGESAMFMGPSWARWSVAEDKAKDLGAFALPGVDGGTAPVFAGGSNIAISAKSKNQNGAFDVLKLIYSDEFQTQLAKNGLGPANNEFTSLMGDDEFAKSAIAAAATAKLTPASPEWAAVESASVMEEFFGSIARGDDPADAAKAADAKLNEMLNK